MGKKKERELKIKQITPPKDKAVVYIIRRQSMARAIKVSLECNGTYIATTRGKRYVYLILDPGVYTFVSKARNIDNLQLHLEANKTYFILQMITTGGIMTITQLKLLDELTGRKKLKKCSLLKTFLPSYQDEIPVSYEYTEESLTPPPVTSKERTKIIIIALIIIIGGLILLLSGIFDLMSLLG